MYTPKDSNGIPNSLLVLAGSLITLILAVGILIEFKQHLVMGIVVVAYGVFFIAIRSLLSEAQNYMYKLIFKMPVAGALNEKVGKKIAYPVSSSYGILLGVILILVGLFVVLSSLNLL